MDNKYQIDFQPPNLTPGVSLLLQAISSKRRDKIAAQNAKTQEEFARLNMQRESNAEARRQAEFEREGQDRVEKAFASARIMRQMGDNAGADSLLLRHGIKATPEIGAPTTTPAQMLTPADVMAGIEKQKLPAEPPEPGMPGSPFEGPASPDTRHTFVGSQPQPMTPVEVMRGIQHGAGTSVPEEGPQTPQVPPPDVEARVLPGDSQGAIKDLLPMTLEPEKTTPGKPTGAYSYTGPRGESLGRSEPFQAPSTTLGDKYDTIYRTMISQGIDPQKAFTRVMLDYEKDQAESARNTRAQNSLTAHDTRQDDQQTFTAGENSKYRSTREEREGIAAGHDRARMIAARTQAANPLKIDTANRQDMGTLRAGFKEWKNTVNLAIDSKSHKRLATAMANLDSGNAMQEREAAESLVSIFKGGGQVTKASQDLLLKHLAGIVGDAQTWIQHKLTGNFGAAELDVLRQATRNALAEEQEKLHGYYESAQDTFGPGSGYEQLGGNVNALVKGAFKQFGYDAPDLYQNAESVVLGSGQRPKTAKAAGKPAQPMVTIRNKKTGETKQVTREEAIKMGAIQ